MATERRSVCGSHSNAAVERVTRQLRVCDTTQSTSTHQCLLRLSGRCSNKHAGHKRAKEPSPAVAEFEDSHLLLGDAYSKPWKEFKCMLYNFSVILEWCIFVELMILYICTCNHHAHIHYFDIKVLKATRFFFQNIPPFPYNGKWGDVVYLVVLQC